MLQTFIELPPFPRKVIGKAKATKRIKTVLEAVRKRGVQIKLKSSEGPRAEDLRLEG